MNNQSLFEQALQRIENGEPFSEVVKNYPKEIQDMLFIIYKMEMFKAQKPLNHQKQNAHKKIFLKQAIKQHRPPVFGLIPRLVVLFLLVIIPLTFSGLASVQALPGDVLYGVKRTVEQVQLNLTTNSSGKLQLEEVFDARRIWEVHKMQEAQRWGAVDVAGWLEIQDKGKWKIEDLSILTDKINGEELNILNGSYVEVNGMLSPNGVEAAQIQLRLFNLSGELTQVNDSEWLVSGTKVEITPETRFRGELNDGVWAEITAIRVYQDRFVALLVVLPENPQSKNNPSIPTASQLINE